MESLPWLTRGRAIGLGVAAVAAVGLAVAAPEIYTGTFSDAGTFLRVALVVVVLAAWAFAVRRLVPNQQLATGLAVVPAAIAIGVFVWPYLRPATEVDEAFPPVASTVQTPAEPTAPADAPVTTAAPSPPATTVPAAPSPTAADAESSSPATSVATDPPATIAPPTVTPTPTTAAPTTVAPTTTAAPTTTTTTTTLPAGPVELRRSGFQGLTGHRGSGDAALYDLGGGTLLLRFEEVDIGSGPDLDVYLVPGSDRRNLGDAVYVAPLTAERGNQNYDIPAGVDPTDGTWTVLVWCETFDVEVANATF